MSESDFAKMTLQKTPEGVLAVVRFPKPEEPTFKNSIIALDGINDPGNLGTIIRIADWFGIDEILVSENTVDVFNPKTVQSSKGSLFRVKIHYCSLENELKKLQKFEIIGADVKGEDIYSFAKSNEKFCLVMGSESHGISKSVQELIKKSVCIPLRNKNSIQPESLNVAVSTGILLSHLLK